MKTDFDQVHEKLTDLGAELFDRMDNGTKVLPPTIRIHLYDVHNRGLVVCSYPGDGDSVGLYTFVGKDGDPVENDLEFIEQFVKERLAVNAAAA